MNYIIALFALLIYSCPTNSFVEKAGDKEAITNGQLKESQIEINAVDDDGWIEIGRITMFWKDGYIKCDGDSQSYKGPELDATLYVKEFNNGSIIYRIWYKDKYYAVSSGSLMPSGKIRCEVTIDFVYCNNTHRLQYYFFR